MANGDPWFSYPPPGISVGPMTLTDDQRKKAADAYAKQQALYNRSILEQQKDFQSSVQSTQPLVAGQPPGSGLAPIAPGSLSSNDGTGVNPPISIFGGDPWATLGKDFGPPAAEAAAGIPAPNNPASYPVDPNINTAVQPSAAAPVVVGSPAAPAAPADPIQTAIDTLSKYFGDPDEANPKQDKADAYAEREGKRTALLAQLAFAAGLTKSGGAGWEGIASGFSNAAGVYDKGFARYQNALQDSADRYAKNSDQKANRKLAITKAGIDLAQSQAEIVRKTWADRQDSIDKMFGDELASTKNDMELASPTARADIMKRWQLSRNQGEYMPPTVDVSDK